MTLANGTRLGAYEILLPLGAGGMGEVYRAKDTRLDRTVAIKVLPEAMAHDRERVLRFEREARLLATLSHANIAAIYGFEEHSPQAPSTDATSGTGAGATKFIVLEYVEGTTLSERLQSGGLPIDDALETCKHIAEALEAAHEKGIVHRDLKPGNVMIRPDGAVKVLDFGLARAMYDESGSTAVRVDSPTITAEYTKPGLVLGTAPYMSPEQARGRTVDKRSDIWSFGVILYECLTGEVLFWGETASDSLGAIMHREPDWAKLPPGTPPTIQLLLRRCLTKDRHKRLHDIGDARIELEAALADPSASSLGLAHAALTSAAGKPRRLWRMSLFAALLLAAAGGGASLAWRLQPQAPVRKFEFAPSNYQGRSGFAISPDGRKIAYVHQDQIWIRDLDQLEPRVLPDSTDAKNPFWSPDSAYVGYMRRSQLWKSAVRGGASVICRLVQQETPVGGAAWGPDGRIVYTTGNAGLYEVSAQGGDPKTLLEPDKAAGERDFHHAALLPGGRGVLFAVHGQRGPDAIALFADGKRRVLLHQDGERFFGPVYSPTGHLIYQRSKTTPGVWAMPFSLSKLEATGEAVLVVPGAFGASLSDDGTMIYMPGNPSVDTRIAWADRQGKVLERIGQPQADMFNPALSPDGTRIAVSSLEGDVRDIWVHDVARGTRTRFTFSQDDEFRPHWAPHGRDIAFNLVNANWMLKATDGVGAARDMGEGSSPSFTPDATAAVVVRFGRDTKTLRDFWYVPLDGKGEARVFLQTPADERSPTISPDGRHIAYVSNESGHDEVYLSRFPSGEGKWQVSVDGGQNPVWNPKGNELFYTNADALYCVELQTGSDVVLGSPRKLFLGEKAGIMLWRGYEVSPDGQRLLVLENEGPEQATPSIVVVENWFEEFRKR